MPYSIKINGITVRCDTATDVAALTAIVEPELGGGGTLRNARPSSNRDGKGDKSYQQALALTLKFLRAISGAGDRGLTSAELVGAAELSGTPAIGGAVVTADRIIREAKMEQESVYFKRGKNGSRRWHPGPRIQVAIQAIESSKGGDSR